MNDLEQIAWFVEIQPMHDAEARAQRRGDEPRARRRSHQREMAQMKRMNPRARPLPDDQVHAKVLHRGIEHLFDGGLQAMNLIEKKNFADLERSENRRQITFPLEHRPSAGLDRHFQLVGDDLRQRGLAQSRRAVQQDMIERLAAAPRCLDGNLDVLLHAPLADVFRQALGPHARFNSHVLVKRLSGDNPLRSPLLHNPFCRRVRHGTSVWLSI